MKPPIFKDKTRLSTCYHQVKKNSYHFFQNSIKSNWLIDNFLTEMATRKFKTTQNGTYPLIFTKNREPNSAL